MILLQYVHRYDRYKGIEGQMADSEDWMIMLAMAIPFVALLVAVLYFWWKKKK